MTGFPPADHSRHKHAVIVVITVLTTFVFTAIGAISNASFHICETEWGVPRGVVLLDRSGHASIAHAKHKPMHLHRQHRKYRKLPH